MMVAYFYDCNNRYVGSRHLASGEQLPNNATLKPVAVADGEQAHYDGDSWVKSPCATYSEYVSESKPIEQRIEEMAEQLVLAQESLDFLIMGGM